MDGGLSAVGDSELMEDPVQVFELALEENARDGLLLIEWPDRAIQEMPPEHLLARFETTGEKSRRITFEARGPRYEDLLRELSQETADA